MLTLYYSFLLVFVRCAWWRRFCIQRQVAGEPFVVFQIILAVDDREHVFFFLVLSVYILFYSILHVRQKKVNRAKNKAVSDPATQSTLFILTEEKMYCILFCLNYMMSYCIGIMVEQVDLYLVFSVQRVVSAQKMDDLIFL